MKHANKKPLIKKSFGVALTRYNTQTQNYEILMIKKRYTYCYVEFVLGHYSKNNDERLLYLFSNMSHDEKLVLLSLDFGKIWYKVWLVDPETSYGVSNKKFSQDEQNRYNNCKKLYEKNFLQDNGYRLRKLINGSKSVDTVWEIPKGRRNSTETTIDCAVREVKEETGIGPQEYRILHDIDPRYFITADGAVTYENYYYIAQYTGAEKDESKFTINPILEEEFWRMRRYKTGAIGINYKNEHQLAEVTDIQWMSLQHIKIISPEYVQFAQNIIKILKKKKIGRLYIDKTIQYK